MRYLLLAVLSVLIGVLAWELVVPADTRREAWDLPVYWQLAYPAMIVGSAVLGSLAPGRAWPWGFAVCGAQAGWLLLKATFSSGVPSLFPLGLALFAVLAIPCAAAAAACAWAKRALHE